MESSSSTSAGPQEFRNSRLKQPSVEEKAAWGEEGANLAAGWAGSGGWGAGVDFAALTGPSAPRAPSRPGAVEIR